MKHTKPLKNAPEKGKIYRVELNGAELYDALILDYTGGCWAKVQIHEVLPSENQALYKKGQTFDLKLGYYTLSEILENEV